MKKLLTLVAAFGLLGGAPYAAHAASQVDLKAPGTPHQDLQRFRAYFKHRFPNVPFADFANGAYAVGPADKRQQWKDVMEFPPYMDALDKGKKLFNTPFANGKTYASCFPHGGKGIRQNYPYFDTNTGKIVTLEGAINTCREKNGEKPLKWKKGAIAQISAYMASTSDGKPLHIVIPNDPRAHAAYERGKEFFYAKRGQLNMSCADCHVFNSGNRIRANTLSPTLGQPTGFPVYRAKWGALGTFHRRFAGCNKQVRFKPLPAQSTTYKDLEYFLTYMSNGLPVNGPSYRE